MSVVATRGVRLSTSTADAWKEAGLTFARRDRSIDEVLRLRFDIVLNLGKSSFVTDDERVWNAGQNIRELIWPGTARGLLGDLMPPRPRTFPADVWIKAPGAAGRGKFRKEVDRELVLPREWDWQEHIDGQEWRIITVGHKVVQDFRRYGENGSREYEWVRMRETPMHIKDLAREAAQRLMGYNLIAWDIIERGDESFILEGNTCPGVNTHTARRVITQLEEQQYARINT